MADEKWRLDSDKNFLADEAREERHRLLRYNLFIIRELYQIIALRESYPIQAFYNYLFADEYDSTTKNLNRKCSDKFQHLMYDTCTISNIAKSKLIDCGIASEFFATEYIKVGDKLDEVLLEYLESNKTKTRHEDADTNVPLSKFRKRLLRYYNTVRNLDGTLLIHPIRELINRANSYVTIDRKTLLSLTDKITFYQSGEMYTGKSVFELYNTLLKHYYNSTLDVPDLQLPTMSTKNIYTNTTKNSIISANYFLIRELYKLFAAMDDVGNAMDKFYTFLEISETAYQDIIDTGVADNKSLAKKLVPFQFPAGMFRGDKPTYISMHKSLKSRLVEYMESAQQPADKKRFYEFLKFEVLYINHLENITLVFPVYNLFHTIKQADSSADLDWMDLIQRHPELISGAPQ